MKEPLVAPAVSICLGIVAAALTNPGTADSVPYGIASALCCAGTLVLTHLRKTCVAQCACLAALFFTGALLETVHLPPARPRLDVPDLSLSILDGCVVETPVLIGNREQFDLELARGARARVSSFGHPDNPAPTLRYGQKVEIEGQIRSPRNFRNPNGFDFRNYLARQHVFWTVSAITVKPLPGTCGNWFDRLISNTRGGALDRIADLYRNDRYNTAMMDAVLVGEGSGLERVWTEDYRSTGTFHALVISGSHVAVLAGVFLFLLRICFVGRAPAIVLTAAAAWLYALVTGWQAPVIRSAAGMSLFALGSLFYRDRRMLNLLAAVVLLFVLLDPDQLFDPSFQLSFLAVAFLVVFAIPLIELTSGPLARAAVDLGDTGRDLHTEPRVASKRVELRLYAATLTAALRLPGAAARSVVCAVARVGCFFFEILVTSAVIQAGLALPMALYFHRVSFTGLSANGVVVPLLGCVVPLGFLAVASNLHWIAAVSAWLLNLSRLTVAWHARFEPNWRIPSPPLWLSVAICLVLAVAAFRWKRFWVRVSAAGSVAVLLALLIACPFPPHIAPHRLELTAIDVGQGDSLFLVFPDGRRMLVDGGGFPKFGGRSRADAPPVRMDIGEDVVAPYLWSRGIKSLDVIAISHLHDDHAGGIPALLNDFAVRELWVGATPHCELWDRIQNIAKLRGTRIRQFFRGDPAGVDRNAVEILAPARNYVPGPQPANDDSLVMRICYGSRSMLLTGDMERPVEWDIASGPRWPHADVLKVGHHGSKTSSTPEFLDQVRPALALISDGWGNLYGHPHRVTLDSLGERHVGIHRTDLEGAITVATDGWKIWME